MRNVKRVIVGGVVLVWAVNLGAHTASPPLDNAVLEWNRVALSAIQQSNLGAPFAARAIAVLNTCLYDSWAAYDERAVGTELHDALRRPAGEWTLNNRQETVSYAAYRALTDLFPEYAASVYTPVLNRLGYSVSASTDINTPVGIANVACGAVLELRHRDGSDQSGDLAPGAYSDWTKFTPTNRPTGLAAINRGLSDPNHWQPLSYVDSTGTLEVQKFAGAHWGQVIPFALAKSDQFRRVLARYGPATYGTEAYKSQADELVHISATLTDEQKAISEYWSDGPFTVQSPGHWLTFAKFVSERDRHTLSDDVKMFFALSNALFDAGIAAWDAKRAWDSVRPISAIRFLYAGQKIRAWGGPGQGTQEIDGSHWRPYQLESSPTPPFPDYVSGHSAYSAAAAEVLLLWTGSDRFGGSYVFPAGGSRIERGITPAGPVTLRWKTFTEAADQAGLSRRYGGIHFKAADWAGRLLGRLVAVECWTLAQKYFDGTAPKCIKQPMQSSS